MDNRVTLYLALCVTVWTVVAAVACPIDCTCESHVMACNNKDEFPENFPSNITHFLFTDCFTVSELPVVPIQYSEAKLFSIHKSLITQLPANAFSSLTNLEILEIMGTNLNQISAEQLVGMSNLTKLVLTGNKLTSLVSGVFTVLNALEILELKGNKGIQLEPDVFAEMPKLHRVDLQDCGFTEFPIDALGTATGLTCLWFAGNPLISLPDAVFHNLHALKVLRLDACHINSISDAAFSGVTHLKELYLSHNNLSEIPPTAFDSFKDELKILQLDSNNLETLANTLVPWPQLKQATFGHNPWLCDCELVWMHQLDLDIVDKHENVTCASPAALAGHRISNVTVLELCECGANCGGNSNTIALAVGIPIVIICVLLIGYYIYKMIQTKRQKELDRKRGRYSAVYKDTTERGGGGGYPHA